MWEERPGSRALLTFNKDFASVPGAELPLAALAPSTAPHGPRTMHVVIERVQILPLPKIEQAYTKRHLNEIRGNREKGAKERAK